MRPSPSHHLPAGAATRSAPILQTLKKLLPYLLQYKTSVILALLCVSFIPRICRIILGKLRCSNVPNPPLA